MQNQPNHSSESPLDTTSRKRVIIAGGRNWKSAEARVMTYAALDRLHEKHNFYLVIHGAARGADQMAGDWAQSRNIPVNEYPADWYPQHYHGKLDRSAGHRRNQQMLDERQPHLVIALPGGPGTKSMMDKSRAAGVPVVNLHNIEQWWDRHRTEHEDTPATAE